MASPPRRKPSAPARTAAAHATSEISPSPAPALAVSVAEAGRRISISRAQAYRLIDAGELPALRIGSRRVVAVVDLEAFLRRLRREQLGEQLGNESEED